MLAGDAEASRFGETSLSIPADRFRSGFILGPYRLEQLLGSGGMGEVYRARDTTLRRNVALKTLPHQFAADPDRLARFKREAQVLASLSPAAFLRSYWNWSRGLRWPIA